MGKRLISNYKQSSTGCFMNKRLFILLSILMLSYSKSMLYAQELTIYPSFAVRKSAPVNTTYYIDPIKGNDNNIGRAIHKPWKTFMPANRLRFSAGDKLVILKPGQFRQSLVIMAKGNSRFPVTITFAPGRYDFFPDSSFKTKFDISNTNDAPDSLKAIAIYFLNSKFVNLQASRAKIVLRGKMIETCVDRSENINIHGISYDYQRPTVSELKVTHIGDYYADLQINPDSKYLIRDSTLTWIGEGWHYQPGWYWQVFDPKTGSLSRQSINLDKVKFVKDSDGVVKAFFAQNPGFKTGLIYQTRDVTRDCAGIFMRRSKNISLRNIRIYFMHGMGVVSQFCENIKMDSLVVKPDERSGRTCSAWADILHFSGCRGLIDINHCFLSAANDDAINVHGTYLKVIEKVSSNQIKVRFMHEQTYGFDAFAIGDGIDFINTKTLLPFENNTVVSVEKLDSKDVLLTLKKAVVANSLADAVVENTTWTPRVWIHNTTLDRIPTRGILITTRRKAVIENCTFQHINMSGILVADDANSWFESGMVRDLTIRKNNFMECGEPVINIHPENKVYKGAVHNNISIQNNLFVLKDKKALAAESASGIVFSDNKIILKKMAKLDDLVELNNCRKVYFSNNKVLLK